MTPRLAPPHDDLTFMTPLSEAHAADLVAFLAQVEHGRVIDLGCGWGELLLRVAEAAPGLRGTGYDLDAEAIAHGRDLAERRGLSDRVELLTDDANGRLPADTRAAICIGASQIWRALDDDGPCDYGTALSALRAAVPRGGRVVYGEGIWSVPPTERATARLGGRPDEFVTIGELADLAVTNGFMPVAIEEASLPEWDAFESGFSAAYAHWLAEHPADHPDAPEVREAAARQRDGYLNGYRGVLGLAYLRLVAV